MAAQCAYCGSDLRPSSMFCLSCGQLAARTQRLPSVGQSPAGQPPGPTAAASPQVATTPARSVVPPVPPASAALPSADSGPHTFATDTEVQIPAREPAPQPATAPRAPVPAARPRFAVAWRLLSGGHETEVTADVYVGRKPVAGPNGVTLEVDDSSRTVSRTHAVIRVDGDLLDIEDLASANGTRIERAGSSIECEAHVRVPLGHGDTVFIGDVPVVVQGEARPL